MEELWTRGKTDGFDPGHEPALGFRIIVTLLSGLWQSEGLWGRPFSRILDSITVLRVTSTVCDGIFRFFSVCSTDVKSTVLLNGVKEAFQDLDFCWIQTHLSLD